MTGLKMFAWILVAVPCMLISLLLLAIAIFAFGTGFAFISWAHYLMPVEFLSLVPKK